MALSLLASELLADYLKLFLYGIYIVTLGMTVRTLLTLPTGKWRMLREINWIICIVCVALFINDTLDTVLAMVQGMNAFVYSANPGAALSVFLRSSAWMSVTKTACVGTQTLLGDAILIWRCWIIWSDRAPWIVVLPSMAWMANFVVNAYGLQLLGKVFKGLAPPDAYQKWVEALWITTICINIITTTLIVLRLYTVERNNSRLGINASRGGSMTVSDRAQTPLGRAMRNIVESGMLITVSSILFYVAFSKNSVWLYPASVLAFHSIPIAFNLIIIRSKKQPAKETVLSSLHFNAPAPGPGEPKEDGYTLSQIPQSRSEAESSV